MPLNFSNMGLLRKLMSRLFNRFASLKIVASCIAISSPLISLQSTCNNTHHASEEAFRTHEQVGKVIEKGIQEIRKWGDHPELEDWISSVIELTKPSDIVLVDNSLSTILNLKKTLIERGTISPLNQEKWPNCYSARSNPEDVARVEEKTFIACKEKENAGPTNNWIDPEKAKDEMRALFSNCMEGRTLYVIPYIMGPLQSPYSRASVELTDSAYVALSLTTMTRVGKEAFDRLPRKDFVKCLHSVGRTQKERDQGIISDGSWPCDPERVMIAHFPEELTILSYGSGYGGNALLNKKCFALRIASYMGKHEGWLAEHMLCIKVTNPHGKSKFFLAAFPSACGKTNLAMLQSPLGSGWKVECLGDDIAWIHWNEKEKCFKAINPEFGFFGVAPGTSSESNPVAMQTIRSNTIFTNVATDDLLEPWWEGMSKTPPISATSWKGEPWTPYSKEKAAHPNSRFTTPLTNCPNLAPEWDDPEGVPISAIIFGGRRSTTVPLVREAFSWNHGVFMAASLSSETTHAAKGKTGVLRHDPFAMLPFCGYHMGDYFTHWIAMGEKVDPKYHPRFYTVNWFLKNDENGTHSYAWPGYTENLRVLEWIFDRTEGAEKIGVSSPIGILPSQSHFSLPPLTSEAARKRLFQVSYEEWISEVEELRSYFSRFQDRMPEAIIDELDQLEVKLHQ